MIAIRLAVQAPPPSASTDLPCRLALQASTEFSTRLLRPTRGATKDAAALREDTCLCGRPNFLFPHLPAYVPSPKRRLREVVCYAVRESLKSVAPGMANRSNAESKTRSTRPEDVTVVIRNPVPPFPVDIEAAAKIAVRIYLQVIGRKLPQDGE